jgi:hypothetical protein
MEYWGRDFKPDKDEFYKEGIINGYITLAIMHYRANSTTGNKLFYKFQSDFDRWTPELWEMAHRFATRNLRAQLIIQSVGNNVNSPIRTSAIGLLQHLQLLYLPSELDIDEQIQQVTLYFYYM